MRGITNKQKKPPHRQQGGSIHRLTQVHYSTQKQHDYFYHRKTEKWFAWCIKKKKENKRNNSYGQISRNPERKIKKNASIM